MTAMRSTAGATPTAAATAIASAGWPVAMAAVGAAVAGWLLPGEGLASPLLRHCRWQAAAASCQPRRCIQVMSASLIQS